MLPHKDEVNLEHWFARGRIDPKLVCQRKYHQK